MKKLKLILSLVAICFVCAGCPDDDDKRSGVGSGNDDSGAAGGSAVQGPEDITADDYGSPESAMAILTNPRIFTLESYVSGGGGVPSLFGSRAVGRGGGTTDLSQIRREQELLNDLKMLIANDPVIRAALIEYGINRFHVLNPHDSDNKNNQADWAVVHPATKSDEQEREFYDMSVIELRMSLYVTRNGLMDAFDRYEQDLPDFQARALQ